MLFVLDFEQKRFARLAWFGGRGKDDGTGDDFGVECPECPQVVAKGRGEQMGGVEFCQFAACPGQQLGRAVAGENPIGGKAVGGCESLPQGGVARIGIVAEIAEAGLDGDDRRLRWTERINAGRKIQNLRRGTACQGCCPG